MTSLTKSIRNFFGTTRAQTNGFVVLLIVVAAAIFSQPLTRWWVSTRPQDFSKDTRTLDSLVLQWKVVESKSVAADEKRQPVYFEFDPNAIDKDKFVSLGFSEKLAARIINYRNKGGRFKIRSDLKKIYGMDTMLYRNVYAYIHLPEELAKSAPSDKDFREPFKPKEKLQKFNLNESDTTQLQKIYGIGSKLALRIVKYRDKLGGFVSQEQLNEVYGLDSAVVNRVAMASYLPEHVVVTTINLNTADEKTLAAHPYFGRRIASAIVAYRFQHGNFKTVDDLGKISLINKENLGKVLPYVTVDP
ncbi:MAG TPA: helix-hairpin-helix domain-containing protein [Cyclobacteriaceae bacterium]|nr:helix-hairpin-helix domain-containing protein [Cyclobacteriaceae bacterium]HMV09903.1 helix-hairpin-helix domain-containing protein [Cyclobacteriaceae bacterium]HMV88729.1 helix-hairpin-helix domain-containing protein [Cyclobacteriaceae bacterium]HMW99641.1 helix-hairpin-helix domain-containing protein [Cyclobacteriaceae bacterium]HMX50982.1 helix-hairpin-helix domain-containing protein [Cyclobacteriaceae bacterium]